MVFIQYLQLKRKAMNLLLAMCAAHIDLRQYNDSCRLHEDVKCSNMFLFRKTTLKAQKYVVTSNNLMPQNLPLVPGLYKNVILVGIQRSRLREKLNLRVHFNTIGNILR